MIEAINTSHQNIYKPQKSPNFSGFGSTALNIAVGIMQKCEQNPMANVAVADMTTAIVPRTIIESKTNAFAGLEAFRRESSGLIINCMIPGVVVAGIAKAIQRPIMGKNSNMSNCWANSDTIELITKYWKKASDDKIVDSSKNIIFEKGQKAKTYNTIKNIISDISGVDGKTVKSFKDFDLDNHVKSLTESVFKPMNKLNQKNVSNIYSEIVKKTHIAENIKIGNQNKTGFFTQNLGAIIKDSPIIIRELNQGSLKDNNIAETFVKKASRLVTAKSLMGLGLILPLAIFAQPFNRWLTEKTSGQKGAPIYKNFGKKNVQAPEMIKSDKSGLLKQKILSVSAILGLAMLSIMKKPNLQMLKDITEFKGIFPSMDQARIISTATFASRMVVAEDEHDLREATVRDMATFSALYFLGDYVAKGIATIVQKVKGVTLINDLSPLAKGKNGIIKNIVHWTKNTALKSSEELVGKAKDYRSICQLGNLGFSLLALGIAIPAYNQHQTAKKCEENVKK